MRERERERERETERERERDRERERESERGREGCAMFLCSRRLGVGTVGGLVFWGGDS